MPGAVLSIYRHEESLPIQEIFVVYYNHPARSQRGKGNNLRGVPPPPLKVSFWSFSHQDLSRKPLEGLSPRDSSPFTLQLFLNRTVQDT